jgi:hypothetical protein
MTHFIITTTNSNITSGSAAFTSTIANSTLTVDSGAYLISMTGGDGADVTDFTAVTVAGLLTADGTGEYGLVTSLSATNDPLALTIGAAGEIYGASTGVENFQSDTLSNAGIIEGGAGAGLYDRNAKAGANTLTNAATGEVIGQLYGIYEFGGGLNVTVAIANSGLISANTQAGIELNEVAATKIVNGAGGRIEGASGIVDQDCSGAEKIFNSGVVDASGLFGVEEESTGAFVLTSGATGRITGAAAGVYDDGASGARTIKNSGFIQASNGDGVVEYTAGTNLIDNLVGGKIFGGGPAGRGIFDGASSGVQTIDNAGLLAGGEYALYAASPTTVVFTNTGLVKGDVYLAGDDTVDIKGGKVNGNIDMSASDATSANKFVATGGVITGEVLFGDGVGNTATVGAGVAGIDFVLDPGHSTNTFIYKAANASTAANLDKITHWQSPDDMIDLSAFASHSSFANIGQSIVSGNDFITLTGTKFEVELVGVGAKLDSSSFTF